MREGGKNMRNLEHTIIHSMASTDILNVLRYWVYIALVSGMRGRRIVEPTTGIINMSKKIDVGGAQVKSRQHRMCGCGWSSRQADPETGMYPVLDKQ
jgi:hypothetical protein